jgi:hypothetical protein
MTTIGKELTRDDSWILEIAKIPSDLREKEPALLQTRWFDYRHLSPANLTYLFVERYDTVYREFYSKTRDQLSSENIQVLMFKDVFESNELLCFWNARQAADEIGCDYDFYIRAAMKRSWDRHWKYIPRPNQLYGEELVLDIKDDWTNQLNHNLKLATNPRFKNDNYVGHPDQIAYHKYLIAQVKARVQSHMILARLMLKEQCLPEHIVYGYFTDSEVKRALSHYNISH